MGEAKVHYMGRIDQEAGRGACGLRLAEFPHTTGADGVTCKACRATSSWREAKEKSAVGSGQSARPIRVVLVCAECGKPAVRFVRPVKGDVRIPSCAECHASKELYVEFDAPRKDAEQRPVHFDFGAGFATCCTGMRGDDERTQNISRVTCLECLRHKVRMLVERSDARAKVISAQGAMADDALARVVSAEGQVAQLKKEITARDKQIGELSAALVTAQDEASRERASAVAHAEKLEAENNRLEEAGIVLSAAVKHVSRALAAFADPVKLFGSKGGKE